MRESRRTHRQTSRHSATDIYRDINAYTAEKLGGCSGAQTVPVNVNLPDIISVKNA